MKKRVLSFMVLLFALSLIFSCTTETPAVVEETPAVEEVQVPPAVAETTPVPAVETFPIVNETKPAEPEYQIIYPQLTYDGAYNGPLYGTSEQVGSASMDAYFENLDRNGINFFIGMFGIDGEPSADSLTSDQGLGEVIDAAQKHPRRVIPFFNPGIGGEEVEPYLGEKLTKMYTTTLSASQKIAGTGFIRGFGEVETQEWTVRHNDPKVLQLVDLAQKNNIHFMFHPVAGKIDDVEKLIELYPDTVFLMHLYREDLDKSINKLVQIMKEHDNLYYSIDAAHILHVNNDDIIYGYDSTNKEASISRFISTYDSKEKSMITSAIAAYKPLVDAVSDKVMWGTEIGPEYAFDPRVFDRAVKISRFVIAGFDKEDQEAVGYKNALRVFGEGVVVDTSIEVIDTRDWADCTEQQTSSCDESCGTPEGNVLTAEQDACFLQCLVGEKCKEVVEMDVG